MGYTGRPMPVHQLHLQPADQQFPFVDHLRRKMIMEIDEQLFMLDYFSFPGFAVDVLQPLESILRKVKTFPMNVLIVRRPADRRFSGHGLPLRHRA